LRDIVAVLTALKCQNSRRKIVTFAGMDLHGGVTTVVAQLKTHPPLQTELSFISAVRMLCYNMAESEA
jgi:hypothetical protein